MAGPGRGPGGGGGIQNNADPGFIPVVSADGLSLENSAVEETTEKLDSSKSLALPPDTLELQATSLKGASGGIYWTRLFDDARLFPVFTTVDDTGTTVFPFTIDADSLVVRDIIQSDQSAEFIGTSITVPRTATDDRIIYKVYNIFGSIAPPDDLRFKLYKNSVAPNNLVIDQLVKDVCGTGTFIANTEFCFDLSPIATIRSGQDFFLVWESASNFSLKTNAAQTIPWEAIDRQDGDALFFAIYDKDGNLSVPKDLYVAGNMVVDGTISSQPVENLRVKDNHIRLNDGYSIETPKPSGLSTVYLPLSKKDTVTAGTFTAGVAGVSNPTVSTDSEDGFLEKEYVQIVNETNTGVYEVLSHTGFLLTVKGVGTVSNVTPLVETQFISESGTDATIQHVTMAVICSGTDGEWEVAKGSDTDQIDPKKLLKDGDIPDGLGYVLATWGANLQTVGRHPAINSPSNSAQITSLGVMASIPVPADGTLDTLTYYNTTGDSTTVLQIVLNGVVVYSFNCVGPYGIETGIGIPVVVTGGVPDNVAIRYSAGTAPSEGLYTAYVK